MKIEALICFYQPYFIDLANHNISLCRNIEKISFGNNLKEVYKS